ncbi:mannose-1-phosphate guanylyltransferase/mannose-6-phosphate isomerase [Noviherbaspirillum sedimenti]|uniref:mannose-1-phosphate guanylyltransferase n=1 Tax=Noviherbaspirillum sedimenti TaxID=2320865 RepID=A0A3A3G0Q4_9BURK|nr:mannose-1-phosphate guanylyltransferase/mannose-6-phosphate isomerase [Noviherbaspirillum sedimenti]RJG02048.1 mannose-1-phosphate guanylyltransferase/mannose-6-phosphate isomerase [Noviherbaspirillum sedimenti]
MNNITPIILCGGSGTRLWPLSRAGFPKQFLVLSGTNSLFQQAIERVNGLAGSDIKVGETLVVTNEEHRFLALDQLRELKSVDARLLLEPVGRNTAPALTLAALQATANGEDPILVVTPADQTVIDSQAFTAALQDSVRTAASGAIVILGITPDRPETGYGYIKHKSEPGQHGEHAVVQFVEKPDLVTAQGYVDSGEYAWNSGIFVLKASVWLKALRHFCPDIAAATEKAWEGKAADTAFVRPDKTMFAQIPGESIDYAVMEQCPGSAFPIRMVSLAAGWNDLGAWDAVWNVSPKDGAGNTHLGDVLATDSRNTLVHATSRLVSLVGVDNLVVIETPDAVLVADKSRCQDVKHIVTELNQQQREEHTLHRKVHRPWGWYDSIDEAERFKVKRIQVKPQASLSLQMHYHRAEHWIVVKGTAEITCGDKTIVLSENQSTYIPLGETHRLSNPGTIPLEIIEVQSGSYLGEDDIVRFSDTYGRKT